MSRDPYHNLAGSRPPIAPLGPDVEDDKIADPARGEKVPRCAACGLPSTDYVTGSWSKGESGRFPLCERCWRRYNEPLLPPDPMQLRETAG